MGQEAPGKHGTDFSPYELLMRDPHRFAVFHMLLAGGLKMSVPELAGSFSWRSEHQPGIWSAFVGLVIYTAAFVAEICQGGHSGDRQGANGSRHGDRAEAGSDPQLGHIASALRVIIPPLTSQMLN